MLLLLCALPLSATDPALLVKRTYTTSRVESTPPQIDGQLNEVCWQGDGWTGDFVQQQPNEGEPGRQKTEFKILFDDQNLYVGFKAFDNLPDQMDIRMSRRDDFTGDCVGICVDSYYDKRTGYEFIIHSSGSKVDLIQMDTGADWFFDVNWDAVWDGATAILDSSWTAEMRIPFSQLRFAKKEEQVWGLHVWRWLHREMEESQFQLIPLDSQGRVHRFGILKGLTGIPSPRRVELLPYVRGSLSRFEPESQNPFRESGRKWGQGLGLDGRIGLSGNFNLDFTVNPDFGQVEADPSVVNLTAFETFYEEKRPFFMEGKQLLDFELHGQSLFYSRRIGRSPGYYPDLGDGEYADVPDNTTIIGAAKFTGKTPSGWSVGLLNSVTAKEMGTIQSAGGSREEVVEPLSNYMVARVQRDFNEGNHSIGAMLTSVNRQNGSDHLHFQPQSAFTGGFDGTFQWGNRSYYINTKAVFSHVSGHEEAITALQRRSAHYFQRPDADHITLDSTRTFLSGSGGEIGIGKGGGRWRIEGEFTWRSPGLDLNDIGFMQMADVISQGFETAYIVNDPVGIFNSYSFSLDQNQFWNFGGDRLDFNIDFSWRMTFRNFWGVHGYLNRKMNPIQTRMLRGGPSMRLPEEWGYHIHLTSDSRKRIQASFGFYDSLFDDGISRNWWIFPSLEMRLTDNFELSFVPRFTSNRDNWQYVNTVESEGENQYILGRIDQKTLDMTIRINYYLTPDLSVQYYGQPFISAGHYSDFKRVTNPLAVVSEDRAIALTGDQINLEPESAEYRVDESNDGVEDYRFGNPNFNFREFRSNLVLRWEYNPGSTLYLVWTHGRSQTIQNGGFNFSHDMDALFDIYPNNVFLIKFNHWFTL